ncbi:MAG TPA: HD domain-containing protein, partial [Bdellovibrionota bacterium]|nr:HD domain-containing protein [Bdellovibrionota bacterium]
MKVQNKKYDFESDIREIINNVSSYFPNLDKDLILRAYNVSLKAHAGQKRISGDEYFSHPLAVTKILTEMRLDVSTIITGLLHDTVEDTLITLEDIKKDFGEDITNLVDGVTKLSKIKFHTSEEKQAENFRKMFIAMAQDIRVIIVKLADRLHNMRTLAYIPDNRQQRIAQETIDVYAPLANRLGIAWMKTEMEDLCLRYLKPEIYYKLVQKVAKKKQERQDYIDEVVGLIEK